MSLLHRHSFFPLVVILLSLLLAGLIYWSVQSKQSDTSTIAQQEVEQVDPAAYRVDLSKIIRTFHEDIGMEQDDLDKQLVTQTALAGLLELRVPAEFKDLHLALAVVLNQIEHELEGDNPNIDEPLTKLSELILEYSWLSQ